MPQPTEAFLSPAFSKASAATYRLAVAVSEGGLSYAITTPSGEVVVAVRHVNPDPDLKPYEFLDKVMFDDALLKLTYGSVEIVSHALRWTLVPDNFAAKADLLPLLQIHHEVSSTGDRVLSDVVRPHDITVIYALTNMLVKRCDYYFKKYTLQHAMAALLRESYRLYPRAKAAVKADVMAHVSLLDGRIYLLVLGPKGLQLANSFRVTTAEDVLYYVLSTLQTLGHDPKATAVVVTGRSELRLLAEAMLAAHLPAVVNAAEHYPKQVELNKAGWAHHHLIALAPGEGAAEPARKPA